MKSTPNNNMRVKQTMFHYFKRVAISRSVRDALCICYFTITISLQRHVFYKNGSAHMNVIFVQVSVLKNIDF